MLLYLFKEAAIIRAQSSLKSKKYFSVFSVCFVSLILKYLK